jgi:hypothetical protein
LHTCMKIKVILIRRERGVRQYDGRGESN